MTEKRAPSGRGKGKRFEAPTVPLAPVHSSRALADAVAAAKRETRVLVTRELLAVAESMEGGDLRPFLRGWLESWEQAEAEARAKEPSRCICPKGRVMLGCPVHDHSGRNPSR
jgi:hypothetical protein